MSGWSPASVLRSLFDPDHGASGRLLPRWIFLRALGLIYYSAFFSLTFQIRGLIGPHGILPAGEYLHALAERFGHAGYWYAPTLLWVSGGPHMLAGICWAGMIASALLVLNFWPRGMLAICFVCFLSFVSAAQDFSAYQSDGMLLEAGFISLFFAPAGFRPGWGEESRPSRASVFLLVWECFRIYFESGVAKIVGGDPQWRNFTALDEYYQNGPLPTWIGWHMQHWPHWIHAATAFGTLALGVLLVDDQFLVPYLPRFLKNSYLATKEAKPLAAPAPEANWRERLRPQASALKVAATAVMLTWMFYATLAQMAWMVKPWPLPTTP